MRRNASNDGVVKFELWLPMTTIVAFLPGRWNMAVL